MRTRHLLKACAAAAALLATGAIQAQQGQAPPGPPPGTSRGPRPNVAAADRHVVDVAAADRGKKTYAAECTSCHGAGARGTDNGPNLIRSVIVLHDRYGNEIGPVLKKGHPTQSGTPSASLTPAQIEELSHFIHQRVYETLRGSPTFVPQDVLTGDAAAGEAFFSGAGRCATCHSPTGDLAGIGRRYDPVDIQQRFVFPRPGRGGRGRGPAGKAVTVTVTPPGGTPISGVLISIDDFHVALRDTDGGYRSWILTPGTKVVESDPYAAHVALLDSLTDKNIHDVVAYLEKLK